MCMRKQRKSVKRGVQPHYDSYNCISNKNKNRRMCSLKITVCPVVGFCFVIPICACSRAGVVKKP